MPLSNIAAPIYFVIGNHDKHVSLKRLLPILESLNFHILRNTAIEIDGYNIIGIDDSENPKQVKKQLADISFRPDFFSILLYHRPK